MEPTSRLYQCLLCHKQTVICSRCDHGQIYCNTSCSQKARIASLKMIRARYQDTFKGRVKHAARQAAYRKRLHQKVTDQGSPFSALNASMALLENKTEMEISRQLTPTLACNFCHKPVSDWLRNNFLRRRGGKKAIRVRPCAQAP